MEWLAGAFRARGHRVVEVSDPSDLAHADKEAHACIFQQRSVIRFPNLKPLAEDRRSVWIQVWLDLIQMEPNKPFGEQHDVQHYGNIMRLMDCVTVKEHVPPDAPERLGIRMAYLPQGIPSFAIVEREQRPPSSCPYDVMLWGQSAPRYKQRYRDAAALVDAGLRVAWAGASGPAPAGVDLMDYLFPGIVPQVVHEKARVVLSVGYRSDVLGYYSDSLLLGLASRRPVVRRCETGERLAPYLRYRDQNQLIRSVRWLLRHPEAAQDISERSVQWLRHNGTLRKTVESLETLIARIATEKGIWSSRREKESSSAATACASGRP